MMRRFLERLDILWFALIFSAVLTVSLVLPIQPNDFWWYVRIGGDIVRTGSIPQVDTLSYTQFGQPVVYHSWLAAVSFWVIYEYAGLTAVLLTRGLLVGAFYILIWLVCREAGAGVRLAAAITLFSALVGSNNWSMRPQLFVYPLFGLVLWILWRWKSGKNGYLWALPLILVFWVNLHGSFVLPVLLAAAALAGGGGDRRKLAWVLIGMLVATIANPRLLGAWGYVFDTLSSPSGQLFSEEWGPPVNSNWQVALFFGWLLAFAPLVGFSPRRLHLTEWLWFLGFGWMALSGIRYVIWFLALLAPLSAALIAGYFQSRFESRPRRIRPALDSLIAVVLITISLFNLPDIRLRLLTDSPPVLAEDTPVEAAKWLAQHSELPGNLWSELSFSSYLVYALPERKVWIDTRFEIYPVEQWQQYIAISNAGYEWEEMLAEEGIELVLINITNQPRLLGAMEDASNWCERYRDDRAVIFVRTRGTVC